MIKVKLNDCGTLFLLRKDRLEEQTCPHSRQSCGDHCPKFVEPVVISVTESVIMGICSREIVVKRGEFLDER